MDVAAPSTPRVIRLLPVQRRDATGQLHVDYRAVLMLAWPAQVTVL